VVLGQVVYLALYNPLTARTTEMFRFLPASVASFVIPAFAYSVVTLLLRRNSEAAPQPTGSEAAPQALARRRSIVAPNI
jgi:hypothetical protein